MNLFRRKKTSEIKLNLNNYLSVNRSAPGPQLKSIARDSVSAADFHDLIDLIDDVKVNLHRHGDASHWDIVIQWNDGQQKRLYKNNRIKAWHKAAHESLPHLPIFLSIRTLGPYLAYLLDVKKVKNGKPDIVIVFYAESLVHLLSDIVVKGVAFFEYCNAIFEVDGIGDTISDEEISNWLNAFVERALRSLRIDASEVNEYKRSIKAAINENLQSFRAQLAGRDAA